MGCNFLLGRVGFVSFGVVTAVWAVHIPLVAQRLGQTHQQHAQIEMPRGRQRAVNEDRGHEIAALLPRAVPAPHGAGSHAANDDAERAVGVVLADEHDALLEALVRHGRRRYEEAAYQRGSGGAGLGH